MKWNEIKSLVHDLSNLFNSTELKLTIAESCTGGLVSAAITEAPGASSWFERAFITYSNLSKEELLSIPKSIISKYGAVSSQVALAMAQGALKHSAADVAISITGIAGPNHDDSSKPVGLVYFSWVLSKNNYSECNFQQFSGNRQEVRLKSCYYVLSKLIYIMKAEAI